MRLEKLQFINFKNFQDKTVDFHQSFNVVIGGNGLGKSTVLAGAQVALGAVTQSIPSLPARPVFRRQFKPNERMLAYNPVTKSDEYNEKDTEIRCWAISELLHKTNPLFPSDSIGWQRVYLGGKETSHNVNHSRDVMQLGLAIETRYKSGQAGLPVFCSFTANRSSAEINFSAKIWDSLNRLGKGYYSALFEKNSFDPIVLWLAGYDSNLKAGYEFEGTREAFFTALKTAFGGYLTDISFINTGSSQDFKLSLDLQNGVKTTFLSLELCSEGVATFFKMVAEIAFRCVLLNGKNGTEAVTSSQGVVLIDELDIMLHPEWQRHVAHDLMAAFPGLQFITTTHSGSIIQSLGKDNIIDLSRSAQDGLHPEVSPKNLSLNEVAVNIMGVDSAFSTQNMAEEKQVEQYLEMVQHSVGTEDPHSENELDDLETTISDPGLRAILKMKRVTAKK